MGFTSFIGSVLIAACGCFCSDKNYIHMMETNLEALDKTMQELEERHDDVLIRVDIEEDKGLQRLAQVQGWLSRVEGVRPQVNDLLKDRSTETSRLCLLGFCSKNCKVSYDYGEQVSKKLKEVEGLLPKGVFEVVAEKMRAPKGEKKHIQTPVGLDAKVKEAWDRLMIDGRRLLGLYGMGGVGKTTLLACINNKFIGVEKEIDIVIWVDVRNDIQNQILGRLRLDKEWKQETEEEKATLIYNNLNRKNFVLLLDDLRGEVDLNKIGVPPLTQENGSKIVFTTRSKEVCKDMEVDDMVEVVCLPPDEAWELFQKKVGENPLKNHPIAREIAKKCEGLPLVLCVIGKAMAHKETVPEWRDAIRVLKSSSDKFPGMVEKIFAILKFSYDSLKDEKVKSCFRYCVLFPEDYEVEKEELIQYWICEGFIDGNRDDGGYDQGHAIIGSLVRSQLLMEGFFSWRVKMHDVMREMALWISSNFGTEKETLCVQSSAQLRQIPNNINWEVAMKISLMRNQIEEISGTGSSKCPNLLTLLLNNNMFVEIPDEFFQFMPALVVLNLSMNSLSGLPEKISKLVSLQYLNLSYTGIQWLPDGLKALKKLINLNLECTLELQSITGIATSLPKLQVLRFMTSGVCIDGSLMEELQHMKHLNLLTATVNDPLILISIQRDERLRSILRGLCLKKITGPIVLSMVALAGLERLEIIVCSIPELTILGESTSPDFKQLYRVHIIGVEYPKDLTWLLFAPNLRYLIVAYSPNIEEIINKEKEMNYTNAQPDLVEPFGKLEFFHVDHLDKLERICLDPPALPSLRQFSANSCPELPEAAILYPGSVYNFRV